MIRQWLGSGNRSDRPEHMSLCRLPLGRTWGSDQSHRNAAPDHVETAAAAYISAGGARKNHPMLSVIIVIHLMLVLGLIGVVLLQKSEGGGLISSTSGFMTGRGTANVLTRTTAFLAAGFFVTSLLLSWIAGFDRKPTSIIRTGAPASQETP